MFGSILLKGAGVAVTTAVLTLGFAPPSHAAGVPADEKCLTLDDAPVLCFTVGAEVFPATSGSTASGSLLLTIGCRTATSTCPGNPVSLSLGQSGAAQGSPTIGMVPVTTLHVPKACFEDICGPEGFDIPITAPHVDGTIATAYVNGTAIPISQPPYPSGPPNPPGGGGNPVVIRVDDLPLVVQPAARLMMEMARD